MYDATVSASSARLRLWPLLWHKMSTCFDVSRVRF